jgi:hypothetical protein
VSFSRSDDGTYVNSPLAGIDMIYLRYASLVKGQTTNDTIDGFSLIIFVNMLDSGILEVNGSLIGKLGDRDGHVVHLGEEVDGEVSA